MTFCLAISALTKNSRLDITFNICMEGFKGKIVSTMWTENCVFVIGYLFIFQANYVLGAAKGRPKNIPANFRGWFASWIYYRNINIHQCIRCSVVIENEKLGESSGGSSRFFFLAHKHPQTSQHAYFKPISYKSPCSANNTI